LEDFVAEYLSCQNISREHVLRQHRITIVIKLMAKRNDEVILVMNGIYLFVQTSSDNEFQRRSFSMQKYRNLLKPMMITAAVNIDNQLVVHIYP
jgi:hypothetical protein